MWYVRVDMLTRGTTTEHRGHGRRRMMVILPPIIRVSIRGLLFILAYNQPGHVESDDGHFASN